MIVEVDDFKFTIEQQLQLTKKAYSASSLNERTLTSTNQIRILKSNKSNLLFSKNDFSNLYKCKIIDKNILSEGTGILTKIDSSYYYLTIVDKTKELFNNFTTGFKDSKILDQYDYLHDSASFTTLHPLLNGSIWVWPYTNMHEQAIPANNPESLNLDYSRPFISVKKVIELIEDRSGWTQNDIENNLIISANHENFYVSTYEKFLTDTYTPSGSVQMLGFDVFDFKHANIVATSTIVTINNVQKTKFSIRLRGDYFASSDMVLRFVADDFSTTTYGTIDLPANDTFVNSKTIDFYTENYNYFNISFFIEGTGTIEFKNTRIYTFYNEVDVFAGDFKTIDDFRIKTYDNLQINTYDLFKSVINLNGFFLNSESFTKKIELNKFSEIQKNNSLDWSDKFEELLSQSANYIQLSKKNYFSFTNDDDLGTLGSAYFDVNSNTDGAKILVKIPYSASTDVEINSKMQSSIPIYVQDKDTGLDSRVTLKQRILNYNQDGSGIFNPISFKNSILNYGILISALKNQEVYEITALITQSDFIAYNFIRPIYISHLQGSFLIISITFLSNESLTRIKLLKI